MFVEKEPLGAVWTCSAAVVAVQSCLQNNYIILGREKLEKLLVIFLTVN